VCISTYQAWGEGFFPYNRIYIYRDLLRLIKTGQFSYESATKGATWGNRGTHIEQKAQAQRMAQDKRGYICLEN